MRLGELINNQTLWEYQRGIKNGNWGADRIGEELREAREEPDLSKKLVEYADVMIITAGSVGALLSYLDLTAEDFENMLLEKLAINDIKYGLEHFEGKDPNEAIAFCRERWAKIQQNGLASPDEG